MRDKPREISNKEADTRALSHTPQFLRPPAFSSASTERGRSMWLGPGLLLLCLRGEWVYASVNLVLQRVGE